MTYDYEILDKDYEYVDEKYIRSNWENAIGLQQVDNKKVSPKLYELANKVLKGEKNYKQVEDEIVDYYENNESSQKEYKEGDIVSARIARLLNNNDFRLTSDDLKYIHKYLFNGVWDKEDPKVASSVGKYRSYNISKKERILGGLSVIYSDFTNIERYVEYDLKEERERIRNNKVNDIKALSQFITNLWETHPFAEGNTRTTTIFLMKYLNKNGIKVGNNLFKNTAPYFRDSLVLNSSNQTGLGSQSKYLERFLDKLINDPNLKLYELPNYNKENKKFVTLKKYKDELE